MYTLYLYLYVICTSRYYLPADEVPMSEYSMRILYHSSIITLYVGTYVVRAEKNVYPLTICEGTGDE